MKRVYRLLIVAIGVITFSSCAVHNGFMSSSASLSQANFNYTAKSISGQASTLKVFGLGGVARKAIVEDAKKDMLEKHPLEANQALANVTVNWKAGFYFIVQTNTCTVTADVVEFE